MQIKKLAARIRKGWIKPRTPQEKPQVYDIWKLGAYPFDKKEAPHPLEVDKKEYVPYGLVSNTPKEFIPGA
jgi:hypothetical protein